MIYTFLCGLNCSKSDYEYLTQKYDDYRKSVHVGYWVRVNILRRKK